MILFLFACVVKIVAHEPINYEHKITLEDEPPKEVVLKKVIVEKERVIINNTKEKTIAHMLNLLFISFILRRSLFLEYI